MNHFVQWNRMGQVNKHFGVEERQDPLYVLVQGPSPTGMSHMMYVAGFQGMEILFSSVV